MRTSLSRVPTAALALLIASGDASADGCGSAPAAKKPDDPRVGVVYEVFLDGNGNGNPDPGERVFVGATTDPAKRLGDLRHPAAALYSDPLCTLACTPVRVDRPFKPTESRPHRPAAGGDPGDGDFPGDADGGGVYAEGHTVRDVLEWHAQRRLDELVAANGGYAPDGSIPRGGPVLNTARPMTPPRAARLFGGGPPPGSSAGDREIKAFKRVQVLDVQWDGGIENGGN